ncbi:hypothetical protein [Eudoraea adriatica]|uniref:hypothetical protein n=1 Tax=Eudoraea adriatica TaxID=446681 RepID=UPI0003732140|nr:hypothetical protein [Eudoraea adriatica]
MKTISTYLVFVLIAIITNSVVAQDNYKDKIQDLKEQKEKITQEEKEALKDEVEVIDKRLERGSINAEEATELKEDAARRRALNIENRLAIIDNKIALLERNKDDDLGEDDSTIDREEETGVSIKIDDDVWIKIDDEEWDIFTDKAKYDRRTYSDLVFAFGLNNAIIKGQSLNDTPYKVWGSRFFEIGWTWRTRVFNNTNFMRFHYGFSFQFNGLKSQDNLYYVVDDEGKTVQAPFEYPLSKSKLRMDNLVFPIHFEFGPFKTTRSENRIRYSLKDQFRIGVGAYGGLNMGTRQKLKYDQDGSNRKTKIKGGLNSSPFIYGLSGYMGVNCFSVYVKYDLNPIFKSPSDEQRNISFGLRFAI